MNTIHSNELLRSRIINHFKQLPKGTFQDAVELFDNPNIREVCNDVNQVSIKLSDMFRAQNKVLTRIPHHRPRSPVKFAYGLPMDNNSATESTSLQQPVVEADFKQVEKTPKAKRAYTKKPKLSTADLLHPTNEEVVNVLKSELGIDNRPQVTITDNSITVISSKFKLTIELT